MSIRDEIIARVSDGRLIELKPLIQSGRVVRHMFVSQEIYNRVQPVNDGIEKFDRRFSQLRADLDRFVAGGEITVAHHPYKKSKKAYLAATDPISDGIWDIRSVDPRPGIRVLGCFSEVDTFVALDWAYRTDLDGPDGPKWRKFIVGCKAHWRQLFGTYQPFSGVETSEYLSENFLDV